MIDLWQHAAERCAEAATTSACSEAAEVRPIQGDLSLEKAARVAAFRYEGQTARSSREESGGMPCHGCAGGQGGSSELGCRPGWVLGTDSPEARRRKCLVAGPGVPPTYCLRGPVSDRFASAAPPGPSGTWRESYSRYGPRNGQSTARTCGWKRRGEAGGGDAAAAVDDAGREARDPRRDGGNLAAAGAEGDSDQSRWVCDRPLSSQSSP